MLCSKCGHKLDEGVLLCPKCGNINFFEFTNHKESKPEPVIKEEKIEPEEKVEVKKEEPKKNVATPKSKKQKKKKKNQKKQLEKRIDALFEEAGKIKDEPEEVVNTVEEPKKEALKIDDDDVFFEDVLKEEKTEDLKEDLPLEEEPVVEEEQPLEENTEEEKTDEDLEEGEEKQEDKDDFKEASIEEKAENVDEEEEEPLPKEIDFEAKKEEILKELKEKKHDDVVRINKTEKKSIDFQFWSLFLLLLACLIFLIFYVNCVSSKKIYIEFENNVYKLIDKTLDFNTVDGQLKGNLMISDNTKEIPDNWQFDLDYGIDYITRTADLVLKTNYNYDEITSVNYVVRDDNKKYTKINDTYIEEDYASAIDDFELKNNASIVNREFKKAFRKTIKNRYISSSKSTITDQYDNEIVQDDLILDMDSFMPELLTNLLKSDEFLISYSKVKGISKEQLTADMENQITSESFPYTFKLYTTGLFKKLVGGKITYKGPNDYSIEVIRTHNDHYNFTYKNGNSDQITGTLTAGQMKEWLDLKIEASNDRNINILANVSIKNKYNNNINVPDVSNSVPLSSLSIFEKDRYSKEVEKNQSMFNYNYKEVLN